jgi:basic amino acid/polyamine antiporter, APA family
LVYVGVKESRNFSNLMVILKLGVVFLIIGVGGYYIFANNLTGNWMPTNDSNVSSFMPNGFSGVMASVASVFFAYIGFDAVSVMAEESKNPQKDLPRSMIYSLVICTVIYILLTFVLSGAVNYKNFNHVDDPLAFIFQKQNLNIGWMQLVVSIVAVVAMTSVLLVFQMGQPRIWMSMSRDGLLPKRFETIHPKYKTPSFATIITGLVVGVPILFTDKTFVLDFTSIATLFAFVLVCGGVLLLPRKEKVAGKFNLPYVNGKIIFPLIVAGALVAFGMSSKNYFGDKFDFTKENQVAELTKMIPAEKMDTAMIANSMVQYIQNANTKNEAFKGLADSLLVKTNAVDKFNYTKAFIDGNNPTKSKTEKISLIIFFLILIGLAVASFVKNYSLIPLLGVSSCLYLLTSMTLNNWIWFGAWLVLGLIVYFLYGYKKSKLAGNN